MSFPNLSQEGTVIVIVKEDKIASILSDCHARIRWGMDWGLPAWSQLQQEP